MPPSVSSSWRRADVTAPVSTAIGVAKWQDVTYFFFVTASKAAKRGS